MSDLRAGAELAAVGLVIFLLGEEPAHACSICLPGDAQFSSLGATASEERSFALYLETRAFSKRSDALQHDDGEEEENAGSEESRGNRLDLYASWTPIDRFTFTLDLPFAWNQITSHHEGERSHSTLSGFGDVSLATSAVLWCPECVVELPALERGAARCPGVVNVAVVNVGESLEAAQAFRARYGSGLPLLRDAEGRLWRRFARGLPANLIRTRDGESVTLGPYDDEVWEQRLHQLGCPLTKTS